MEELEPIVMKDVGIRPKKKISIGYIILIIIVVLIIAGILGIFSIFFLKGYNKSRYKDEFYVQQEALEYLEKRYDEEFIVMYNRGMGPAYNYVQLYGYPKGYSDEKHKFEIQGYYNKWGKLDYYDSYVMVKLTDEYEAYLDKIIGEYFNEYKLYLTLDSEWLTSNLSPNTRLEDLLTLKANEDYPLPRIFLYLNSNEEENYNDKNISNMSKHLQESRFRGLLSIIFYYNDEIYSKRNRENVYEALEHSTNDVDGKNIYIYSNEIKY